MAHEHKAERFWHLSLSSFGKPYFIWELEVPRIPDDFLRAVFYLYPSREAAEEGEARGGSGFLVRVGSERVPDLAFCYAVTNSHMLREGRSHFFRVNTQEGRAVVLESNPSGWHHHPDGDDIAVHPLILHPQLFHAAYIPEDMFVTKELIKAHDIGIGDDVFMVGRYMDYDGKQKNLPSVRFGNISIMQAFIPSPRGLKQESFVVEMRSIGGYSGSPIFFHTSLTQPRHNSTLRSGAVFISGSPSHEIYLLVSIGVITKVFIKSANRTERLTKMD